MLMIRKNSLFSRAAIVASALALSVPFNIVASTSAMTPQSLTQSADATAKFAGTWHWMCNGKTAVTMVLSPSETGFTGSVSAIEGIQLGKDGTVLGIDPGDGTRAILQASLDGSVLHFKVKDGSDETEWIMTLKEGGIAQVQGVVPAGEGPAMKPIEAEKAR